MADPELMDDIVPSVVFENDALFLREILSAGASADRPNAKGLRPLHGAALYGHLDCLRVLLDFEANVNATADDGTTPLHKAASGNNERKGCDLLGCIQLLIEKGALLDAKDGEGRTPIRCADEAGNDEIFDYLREILTKRRAEEMHQLRLCQFQKLTKVCEEGDIKEVETILAEMEDLVNFKDESGHTALYRSCMACQLPIVRCFMKAGAVLLPEGDAGLTPLDICAGNGNIELVSELVMCTGNDASGSVALHQAVEAGQLQIVEMLLLKQVNAYKEAMKQVKDENSFHFGCVPVDVNYQDDDGLTALHKACKRSDCAIVTTLLKYTQMNIRKHFGIEISSQSVESDVDNCSALLPALLKNIVLDLEVRSKKMSTAFHLACRKRNFEIIELLAAAGANVNVPWRADNALVDACVKRDVDLACLLLRLGAKDSSELDAFRHAMKHDDDEILALLLASRNVAEIDEEVGGQSGRLVKYAASWNDVTECWKFKVALMILAPKFLTKQPNQPAAITRLHLKKNVIKELPLELFQMPHLEFLDVSFNDLELLPSATTTTTTGGDTDERSDGEDLAGESSAWTCHCLSELKVSNNRLLTLPSDLFHAERLAHLKAQDNQIAHLPVAMWMAPALEEINLSGNQLNKLPRPDPLTVTSTSPTTPPTAATTMNGVFCETVNGKFSSFPFPRRNTDSVSRPMKPKRPQLRSTMVGVRETLALTASAKMKTGITVSSLNDGGGGEDDDDDEAMMSLRARTYKSPLKKLNLNGNKLQRIPVGLPCLAQKLEQLEISNNEIINLGHPSDYPVSLTLLAACHNGSMSPIAPLLNPTDDAVCYGVVKASFGSSFSVTPVAYCSHRRHAILPNLTYLKLAENEFAEVPLFFIDKHVEESAVGGGSSANAGADTSEKIDDNRSFIQGAHSSLNGHGKIHHAVERHLFPSLELLDVSLNRLTAVPHRCWDLKIGELILNGNKAIVDLPLDMGLMASLYRLEVDETALESVPSHVDRSRTKNIVLYLRSKRDKAREYRRLKLMVVGRQKRGKSTLIRRLKEGCKGYDLPHFSSRRSGVYTSETTEESKRTQVSTVGVDLGVWKYGKPSRFGFIGNVIERMPEIEFLTWDFAGQEDYYTTHQCFLSKRALYLVLWNVNDGEEGINEVESWLRNIQARAPGATVLLVGTHIDVKKKGRNKDWLEDIYSQVCRKYMVSKPPFLQAESGFPSVVAVAFVGCEARDRIDKLRDLIYDVASSISETRGAKRFKLLEQKFPQKYLQLEDRVLEIAETCRKKRDIPVVFHQDFKDKVADVIIDPAELTQAVDFLHQNGTLLHYNDQSLRHLYFIDPQWLCDILAHVVTIHEVNPFIRHGLLACSELPQVFSGSMFAFREQFISLLTKFEVAVPVGLEREYLLIPSKLPDYNGCLSIQPYIPKKSGQATREEATHVWISGPSFITRFYYLIYIPSGFWPRIISRFLSSSEFSRIVASSAVVDRETGEALRRHGDDTQRPLACQLSWSYWKTGVELRANSELILSVKEISASEESILGPKATENDGTLSICLYGSRPDVLTTDKYRWIEILVPQLECARDLDVNQVGGLEGDDFNGSMSAALVGTAVELIDGLLEDWYPELACGGRTPDGIPRLTRIAACPKCVSRMKEEESLTQAVGFVFLVQECSWRAQVGELLHCPSDGDISVEEIAPDLVFRDLNVDLVVSSDQLEEEKLIDRSNAEVWKGWFFPKGTGSSIKEEVAIKKIQKDHLVYNHKKHHRQHSLDVKDQLSTKAYKSYIETRQEVGVLGKLNHPRIVRLIGIRLDPCGLVLEWALKGSLESVLKTYGELECLVEPRPLRLLIIQVAEALGYLHEKGIVYRDLKSANVLVWKFPEPMARQFDRVEVQVKLADFGISRSADPHGRAKGEVGTQGFQAPEIVLYGSDEDYGIHVDIYSFAMLLYEVLSLKPPFSEYMRMEVEAMVGKGRRPVLPRKRFQYPLCVLDLMKQCWAQQHDCRPLTPRILSIAKSDDFLRLLEVIQLPAQTNVLAACVYCPADGERPNGSSNGEATVSGDDGAETDEVVLDEIWWSSHGPGSVANVNGRLCRADYDAREKETNIKHYDVPTADLLGSVCVVRGHIVLASHSMNAQLFVYEAASSCRHEMKRSYSVSVQLTNYGILRQLLYAAPPLDRVFAVFDNGVVISVKGERLIAADGDPFADAEVGSCNLIDNEQQIFCAVAVVGGDRKSSQDVELWCGLSNAQIAVIRPTDSSQTHCIDVALEPDSYSEFKVSSVACLTVTRRSPSGEKIVWGSVQPGTVIYGWRAMTKRPYTTINSMDYIEDYASSSGNLSAPHGSISVLQSQGSQLYIGTANGCILVVYNNRVTQILHAHRGSVSALVPLPVDADDPQWLPRFWRRHAGMAATTSKDQSELSSSAAAKKSLLLSFGLGSMHEQMAEESDLAGRGRDRASYLMIWLVDQRT